MSQRRIRRIEERLQAENVCITYERISSRSDAYYLTDGSNAYITIAPELSEKEQNVALAHEAGHHFTGLTKHKGRDEERANRWAALELLKPVDIINATISGCQSYHELAEMLDLDEDFVKISLQCFRRMYGAGIEIDGYYLHLYPIWVKELETGRIWPEE